MKHQPLLYVVSFVAFYYELMHSFCEAKAVIVPVSPTPTTLAPTFPMPGTKPIISVCTGWRSACAVFNDNKVKCWGRGDAFGMPFASYSDSVGNAMSEIGNSLPYVDVSNTTASIEKVYCGYLHTCIKFASGGLKCIGSNIHGQAGLGISTASVGQASGHVGGDLPFISIGAGLSVIDVSLGFQYGCVIVTGNKVKCFGRNINGQLGLGDKADRGLNSNQLGDNLPFLDLGTGAEVASIHSGSFSEHSCAILLKPTTDAQRLKCWGYNFNLELGYGTNLTDTRGDAANEMGDSLPLVDLGSESRVKQVSIGSRNTCVLLITDALKCWGSGNSGQLASGSFTDISSTGDSLPAVLIDSGKTIKQFGLIENTLCIFYTDNVSVKCVGNNNAGQLGQGDTNFRGHTPTTKFPNVPAINFGTIEQIQSLHVGSNFNCILLTNSLIKCWGSNDSGQLAVGSTENKGDNSNEMGNALAYAQLFPSTASPTKTPTVASSPTASAPTKSFAIASTTIAITSIASIILTIFSLL